MSLALSSADEDVINRTVAVSADSTEILSDAILKDIYAVEKCVEWVVRNDFKRIALQFPDDLLGHSVSVYRTITELSQRRYFLLGDTTYSGCCVDEIAAEHASCDAAIHFGPSCLSPASRLPVALVFPSCRNFNVQHFIATVQPVISSGHNSKEVILLYDTAFFPVLGEVYSLLPSNVIISQIVIPENQTVISADADSSRFLHHVAAEDGQKFSCEISRRRFPSSDPSSSTFLYMGHTSPCMVNLFLQLPSSPFYSYDPEAKSTLNLESAQINKRIMRRLYLIERAKDARIVGILIGTLGVKDYLEIIDRLKTVIKTAGKRFYTFSMGKPNPAKLANFTEVDVFVYVACPESFFDSKEYLKPVVTPHEMEIACGQRPIDEGFVPDFRSLLPGGVSHVAVSKIANDTPDVSLITGSARVAHQEEEIGREESLNGRELVARDHHLTVSTQKSAGDVLAGRTWKGLEPNYGRDGPGEIVDGQHGIALSYNGEMAS